MDKRFIKRFTIISLTLIILVILVTVFFDPFYHYHGVIPGFKKVLEERNYPLPGSIDNFDYDSLQVGSSVMENNNDAWFDELFGCKTLKIAKGSSSISELCTFVDRAYEKHNIKNVFFCLDSSMLIKESETAMADQDFYYLYDKNPLNDQKYLLNKDILFKKIPIQIAYSFVLDYDEGESYNWYRSKTFSKSEILSRYYPYEGFMEESTSEEDLSNLSNNLTLLKDMVSEHPETVFYLYFSPASILFWDSVYREGKLNENLYAIARAVEELTSFDNVKMYAFNTRSDIILNLDNYMDTVHHSRDINYDIVNSLYSGDSLVDSDNIKAYLDTFKETIIDFSQNGILEYYPNAIVN